MPKQWKLPAIAPENLAFDLFDVPPFVVQILYNRGLTRAEDINRFLAPDKDADCGDPASMCDMAAAVQRVRQAISRAEPIAVYGDFDVDGICSAALLHQVLAHLGAKVQVYIPHRVDEGYGLNKPAITTLAEAGVKLLISADCGTSAFSEVDHAGTLGVDVIVTDHHHVHDHLPKAVAVLNPHRPDCVYPFKELAGVGVAYKLAKSLLADMPDGFSVDEYIDLVALGTVVDVAPIIGENRRLVRAGLAVMRSTPRLGLKALMDVARVSQETLRPGNLAFALGPRLNAAGRMDSAKTSYQLLLCTDPTEAKALAQKLEEQNLERQKLLEQALLQARQEAAEQVKQSALIMVANEGYPAGIVGLVAGRLAEEFYRPAVAVERGEKISHGSCRSISEFHIAAALEECHDILERHGGHAMAAGFTVRSERLPELYERLAAIAARKLDGLVLERTIGIDCVTPISQANWDTLAWVKRMEPFGIGNPAPVFQSVGLRLRSMRPVGKDHLRLTVSDGQGSWNAIAFRQVALATQFKEGDLIDLLYTLDEQTWNGEHSLQLEVKDARRSVN